MSAEQFLASCQRVKRMGPSRWVACCPAHDDSTPSLNVKEMPDGKVLAICRAGCSTQEILDAAHLPWSVMFAEEQHGLYYREAKKAFPAADVLRALAFEALVVTIITSDLKAKKEIKQEEWDRLALAYSRIDAARKMALGDD